MRELEFRAWDKVEKKMLFDADPFALHVSGSNEPLLAKTHRNDDCIFEQYTRLKDMFGNKIYDGDIVRNLVYDYNSAVEQAPSGAWVAKDDKGEVYEIISDIDCVKVIGNIHENPELLEAKK